MGEKRDILKAPFPAFGGKSQVADMVWRRLGDPRNYIEPFAFTAAVLLRRRVPGAIETINDLNSYVANFWRAVQHDPEAVARHADWPVVEDDLHARHKWLMFSADAASALSRVREDPDHYDARIAGWWCWGACCWIGSGWCDEARTVGEQIPMLSTDGAGGRGVIGLASDKRPQLCNGNTTAGPGVLAHVPEKLPLIGDRSAYGRGALAGGLSRTDTHRPQLADAFARGRGVNGNDRASVCADRRAWLTDWMARLADRMRPVRVCCGHWARVCDSESTLTRLGLTGVFLDPPYRKKVDGKVNRHATIYANDAAQDVDALCDEVQAWSLRWGDNREMRIAVCGLEGEYPLLDAAGWDKVPWKSRGGYGNRTQRGKDNAARERIWFSPHCLPAVPKKQMRLFGEHEAA